ncbi:MAG: sigma-70 family RNA polymerase sigma factor [Patescibacteria group bacterium]|nr:sigma-70 family RNA polymerase sigma factor [Patescibacteria group bacterium]
MNAEDIHTVDDSTRIVLSEMPRRMTRARQFVHSCFRTVEEWDDAMQGLRGDIDRDLVMVSASGPRPMASTDQVIEIARLSLFHGLTIDDIQQIYPGEGINIGQTALYVRDLLVLSMSDKALQFGYSAKNCSRRAKRTVGVEARTKFQSVYSGVLTKHSEAFDPEGDLYQQWVSILDELRNPLANNGKVFDISAASAVDLVRMIFIEGYNFRLAADKLGLGFSSRIIKRIAFVSIFALRSLMISLEDYEGQELESEFPVLPNVSKDVRMADRMVACENEKVEIRNLLEDHKNRYAGDGLSPYLNPLQIVVLDMYVKGEIGECITHFEGLGMSRDRFIRRFRGLRSLALGHRYESEKAFVREYRSLIFRYYSNDLNLAENRVLARMLEWSNQPAISGERCIEQALDSGFAVESEFASVSHNMKTVALNMRLDGINIRTIAKKVGCGKTTMYHYFLSLERAFNSYYFPSFAAVRNILFLAGTGIEQYLRAHTEVFQGVCTSDLTGDELFGWQICGERSGGMSVRDVMRKYALSEQVVSCLTHLGIVAKLKYADSGVVPNGIEAVDVHDSQQYECTFDPAGKELEIGGSSIKLTRRQYGLLYTVYHAGNGGCSIDQIYPVLYPDDAAVISKDLQWRRVVSILSWVEDRLGRDQREQPFFLRDSSRLMIKLNPNRWNLADERLTIYYAHYPFAPVSSYSIHGNRLKVTYFDDHDRWIELSQNESVVMKCLLENVQLFGTEVNWVSRGDIISYASELNGSSLSIYALRTVIAGLLRKLCISFPDPGYILSDRKGSYRVMTYEDGVRRRTFFETSLGIFSISDGSLCILDEHGNICTRLTRKQENGLKALLFGAGPMNYKVKHNLLLILRQGNVLPRDAGSFFWERGIRMIGDSLALGLGTEGWKDNIAIVKDNSDVIVTVFVDGSILRSIILHLDVLEMFEPDPLISRVFDLESEQTAGYIPAALHASSGQGSYALILAKAKEFPLLSPLGEIALLIRMTAGDVSAEERLFRSHMLLVISIVMEYCAEHGYEFFFEFIQEGNLGLIKALSKFDITYEGLGGPIGRVSTYATMWIRNYIQRCAIELRSGPTLPQHVFDFNRRVYKIRTKLELLKDFKSSDELVDAICEELLDPEERRAVHSGQVPIVLRRKIERLREKVVLALNQRTAVSLNEPAFDDGSDERGDLIRDDQEPVHTFVEVGLRQEVIRKILTELDLKPQEKVVMDFRFGFNGCSTLSLEEIGGILGLCGERVRQIEAGVLSRMRHPRYTRRLKEL